TGSTWPSPELGSWLSPSAAPASSKPGVGPPNRCGSSTPSAAWPRPPAPPALRYSPRDFSHWRRRRSSCRPQRPSSEAANKEHVTDWYLNPGERIARTKLHNECGGNRQSGIASSASTPNILIFTDPAATSEHAYSHDWQAAE